MEEAKLLRFTNNNQCQREPKQKNSKECFIQRFRSFGALSGRIREGKKDKKRRAQSGKHTCTARLTTENTRHTTDTDSNGSASIVMEVLDGALPQNSFGNHHCLHHDTNTKFLQLLDKRDMSGNNLLHMAFLRRLEENKTKIHRSTPESSAVAAATILPSELAPTSPSATMSSKHMEFLLCVFNDLAMTPNNYGHLPLHYAIKRLHRDPSAFDNRGRELIEALVEINPQMVSVIDVNGDDALDFAHFARSEKEELNWLYHLLLQKKIKVYRTTKRKWETAGFKKNPKSSLYLLQA